ncbi:CB1 cannabinoid receptor-interacting protein 1-like [Tropilaelaps mercedesae]|uniref:CB1 cannabinoid receptor-interacting protein 1 n=1 Tax=Tropilaelaps mercedesae TaxID=418985 RepID=A0A1V9XWD1_9ACAR|nr:CB1 cannabinoid receptor-interacting protein 1-like [Tropilaelaps mercedesae]
MPSGQGALASWKTEVIRGTVTLKKVTEADGSGIMFSHPRYKGDGSRFDLDTTIKLNVNSSYELSIIFRPVVRIERMEIMGDVKVPSEKSRDIESITYVTYFDTKAKQTSKNGNRDKIHLFFDLGDHGLFNFDLQAKYYAEKDNHVAWGNPLHYIELEASCIDGEVKLCKTLFR